MQSLLALAACDSDTELGSPNPGTSTTTTPSPTPPACNANDTQGTRIAFLDETEQVKDTPVGEGLDGRLYTNLTPLACASLIIPNDRYPEEDYVLGEIRAGRGVAGLAAAISAAGAILAQHFPPGSDNPDELPNHLIVLPVWPS